MTLETIAGLVEWQAADVHVTRQGKRKPVLVGIPKRKFWDAWKADKLRIRDAGLSLSYELTHRERETATGQACRRGGACQQPRPSKSWTVTAWLSHRNARLADIAGFAMPTDERESEPVADVICLPCGEDGMIDCPF